MRENFELVKEFADKNRIEFISAENADHQFTDPLKMDIFIKTIADFYKFNR